jgi:hypothetical protein
MKTLKWWRGWIGEGLGRVGVGGQGGPLESADFFFTKAFDCISFT